MAACIDIVTEELKPNFEKIIENILNGKICANGLEQKLHETFIQQARKIDSKQNDIGELTFLERIQRVKRVFDWKSVETLLQEKDDSHLKKSTNLSTLLREKGNVNYKDKKLSLALRAYTLAATFAPEGSEELALAYANRSAVLLQLNKYSEAQDDIKRSLSFFSKFPNKNFQDKLNERAVKCSNCLKTSSQNDLKKKKEEMSLEVAEKLFQITDPNENIPNAKKFVNIQFSPEKGRHLIVEEDVEAGTVLLVDQPYVSVLNNLLSWEVEHCHNCYKQIWNGIPCKNCVFAVFCNDKCQAEAYSSSGMHQFEDSYLPLLCLLNASHKEIQSLRILSKVGLSALLNLWKSQDKKSNLKNDSDESNTKIAGFDTNGIYNCDSYLPIYNLISHNLESVYEEGGTSQGTLNAINALFLKSILKENSRFFHNIKLKSRQKEEFEDFISSLILRHLESIKFNAISQSKLTNDGTKSEAFAAAVYPLMSLCNHSCDPNCAPVKQLRNLRTCLISLKHLKKGDELFITYKPLYSQMKKSERQSFLAENYRFICNCLPCEGGWGPQSVQRYSSGGTLILEPTTCSSCLTTDKIMGQSEKSKGQGKQCHDCALKDVKKAREIREMEQILFECHKDMVEEGGYLKNLERLPNVLDYFGRNEFQTHFPLYFIALDLFKRALVHCVSRL